MDHSQVMLEQAAGRNKKQIEKGKVKLACGTVWDLQYPENYFDTIYGSNVHFFWKDPVREFNHLVPLLKPGGRLVMVFQPRWTKTEVEVREVADRTRKQYEAAGLTSIEIDYKVMTPVTCICISGQKK
jgi:SAM-dependent methyltransferase